MIYTKHRKYKTRKFKCNGCKKTISQCKDDKKQTLRVKEENKKFRLEKEYIHVESPKCKHCIQMKGEK